ncbi:MAG: Pr6Pr family membrane protein [Promethearchaeota archaeon]
MKININSLNQKSITIYRLIVCLLGWTNLILLMVFTNEITENGRIYRLYAFQANFLAILWLTISLIFYKKDEKPKILHLGVNGAVTSYNTIALLTYIIFLAPRDSNAVGIHFFTSLTVHIIIPIAVFIDWLLTSNKIKYKWVYSLYWAIYPICYIIFCLISGIIFNDPIYPFFDVNLLSIGGVAIAILGLTIFFIILASLYIFMNRRLYDTFYLNQ